MNGDNFGWYFRMIDGETRVIGRIPTQFFRRFMPTEITEFSGPYRFLSNFWMSPFRWNGHAWKSSEHAYQAMKAIHRNDFIAIRNAETPLLAKRLARRVEIRKDWDKAWRLTYMRSILDAKFAPGSELAQKILDTGDAELIEGNTWGDEFWGVCNGVGKNYLGRMLMEIRDALKK